jgi:cyclophilin family peptidyl-prolyl cis-trans isomerase
MAQFGLSGDPGVSKVWSERFIRDDQVLQSNVRGTLTFATSGRDTRSSQLFINYADNKFLDRQGFSPVGRVVEGMAVVDSLFGGYGEGPPTGRGPNQRRIVARGTSTSSATSPCWTTSGKPASRRCRASSARKRKGTSRHATESHAEAGEGLARTEGGPRR